MRFAATHGEQEERAESSMVGQDVARNGTRQQKKRATHQRVSDQLDLGNYIHHAASELERRDWVEEELACAAHQSSAFDPHHLAAAVVDTFAVVGSLAVAVGIDLAVAAAGMDRDRRAGEAAARMHHKAECSEVDHPGRATQYVQGRRPVSEQRLE